MLYYQIWVAGMSLFIRSLQLEVIGTQPKDTAMSDGNFGTVTSACVQPAAVPMKNKQVFYKAQNFAYASTEEVELMCAKVFAEFCECSEWFPMIINVQLSNINTEHAVCQRKTTCVVPASIILVYRM